MVSGDPGLFRSQMQCLMKMEALSRTFEEAEEKDAEGEWFSCGASGERSLVESGPQVGPQVR
jgi:hypothetical protein